MSDVRALKDIGEFELIERIASIVGDSRATVGIGDDAAVLDQPGSEYLLATVDMLVEDVHFRRNEIDPVQLGARAMAVNLSDIAAMGGTPTFALTSLAAPPDLPLEYVEQLYTGLRDEGSRFQVSLVGGNVARTAGPLTIDVTLLGVVPKSEVVLRSGSMVDDVLVVTGALGDEAARRLERERSSTRVMGDEVVPEPRIGVGRTLAAMGVVHAMLDISDGLAGDVRHLTRASGVGAVIYEECIPISRHARQVAHALTMEVHDLALYGGEDYELLIALSEGDLEATRRAVHPIPLYRVGTIVDAQEGIVLEIANGERRALDRGGWTHF